jgi:hypothetical protein
VSRTLTLAENSDISIDDDRVLSRAAGGRVIVRKAREEVEITDDELREDDDLFVWTTSGWILALGEHSHTLLGWTAETSQMRRLGALMRLDLESSDPGGLNRVGFLDVDDSRCLVETEVAFALVERRAAIVWENVHDDLTCRVVAVRDGLITTQSEYGTETYSLADGAYIA